jgi:hypothetical protein
MADLNAVYTLMGPDGTRVVWNDPDDADFDGPETRESSEDRVEGDGGNHGDFWHGRRPITLEGIVWPDPVSERAEREDRIQRATNAMRADATLSWTPEGQSPRRLLLRRAQPPRITGRRPKNMLVAMVSDDAVITSPNLNSLDLPAGSGVLSLGMSFPMDFPLTFQDTTGGPSTFVVNAGNAESPPILTVQGAITNPIIRNETVDKEIRLIYDLAAGDSLTINVDTASILLNGTTNRYSALDFGLSEWWNLVPGSNDVRLISSAFSGPAGLTVQWRDAWI